MEDQVTHNPSDLQSQPGPNAVFTVLGVRINAVQIPDVVAQMELWISRRERCHFIAVTGMHGITEAQHDLSFKQILNSADLVVPDGMPVVWLGRWRGQDLRRRVYGPELMERFCALTGSQYRHFFYGGMPGVANRLAEILQQKWAITVAGEYSPPFHGLSEEQGEKILQLIHAATPDVLWIGLSTPKQERWMYEHRPKLRVPVVVGVGAAFDINTGRNRQAPYWMREHGLEWSFRLLQEPRRLWRRYIIYGSEFVWRNALELLQFHKFDGGGDSA